MEKIFLLGGYDLEMVTIKELLNANGIRYYNKELSWNNALLNNYKDILQKYANSTEVILYGIELRGESIYSNYKLIDHHNEYSHLPSAIEQVAAILNIPLSRYQLLVAANDYGYIPELERKGASKEEINEIRFKDRAAQGVTMQDELNAEKAIKQIEIINEINVIKLNGKKFSPVCDKVYPYNKLLIYNETVFCYYGNGKDKLVLYFKDDIKKGKIYHGGGESGYLGSVEGSYLTTEILELINIITKL